MLFKNLGDHYYFVPMAPVILMFSSTGIWVKVFQNGPSKICGRQPLKSFSCTNFTWSILEYLDPYDMMDSILVKGDIGMKQANPLKSGFL